MNLNRIIAVSMGCALLAGCDVPTWGPLDPAACKDYRVITYYDNMGMPATNGPWKGPRITAVCIVSETRIAAP